MITKRLQVQPDSMRPLLVNILSKNVSIRQRTLDVCHESTRQAGLLCASNLYIYIYIYMS